MIAGTTAFDANDRAPRALLAEWTSARTYAGRVANLRGTGSGSDFANRRNGDFFLQATGTGATVVDDGARDVLFDIPGVDWLFAGLLDVIDNGDDNDDDDDDD